MNKLWTTIALLIALPQLCASDIIPHEQSFTPITFTSKGGAVKTIGIADSDSIGIVYSKVVKAFGWNSHSALYCHCHRTYILLALDITDNFLEILKLPPHNGSHLAVTPHSEPKLR